jgi:Helix-turn-helix domain
VPTLFRTSARPSGAQVKRKLWSPDDTDVLVVQTLLDVSGKHGALVVRSEFAELVKVPVVELAKRLKWLCEIGYLRRERSAPQGYSRYVVVKTATVEDVVDLGLYSRVKSTTFDVRTAREAVQRYKDGASIKELMEHYGASYAVVRAVLTEAGVEIRPGGPR